MKTPREKNSLPIKDWLKLEIMKLEDEQELLEPWVKEYKQISDRIDMYKERLYNLTPRNYV